MSARKVLELAEQQGLLDERIAAELRQEVATSKFEVAPEAIAKLLVDQGHLTQFQANKLVAAAAGPVSSQGEAPSPPPTIPPASSKKPSPPPSDDLWLAEDEPTTTLPPKPSPSVTRPLSEVDDDIVMLEAVEPLVPLSPVEPTPPRAPKPPRDKRWTTAPPPPKGSTPEPTRPANTGEPTGPIAKSAQPGVGVPAAPREAQIVSPSAAGSLQALPTLTPLSPTPLGSAQGPGEQTPVPMLTPLGTTGDDLFGGPDVGDPALAAGPLMGEPPPSPRPSHPGKKPLKRNQWDSPLLLIGGGLGGVLLVVFGLLFFALTRGSAKEMFNKAEEEYRAGAYASAMGGYETFLKRYPNDPDASLARVRLGLAQIRQVSDRGGDPEQSMRIAREVLPTIENETSFNEARLELASILPDIADAFADRAKAAEETARKEELVKKTEEAMELVTNPGYIPGSLRKDIENRVAGIMDKVKAARRGIDQDNELVASLQKIDAAVQANKAAEAYEVRHTLLRNYPALQGNKRLDAAIRSVADRERELVQVTEPGTPASTEDTATPGYHVVLAAREGTPAKDVDGHRFFTLTHGAVYALDATRGTLAWRRYVGGETTAPPIPLSKQADSDVLVTDARSHSLLRLKGASGKLVWKQTIGVPFWTPALAGDHVLVTTSAGNLLEIKLEDGVVVRQVQFPQQPTVGASVDAKSNRIYQLGEHSTIFVLDAKTLQCVQTYYLGHRAGAILAPPEIVLDHLFVPESPKDDHTLLHVLKPAEENGELVEIGDPFRLRGRIAVPMAASGRRLAAITDLGQIAVYEVDAANSKQPVRALGSVQATESQPVAFYPTTDGRRLWLAGRRCSMYEIQGSVQQLNRGWTVHQDDTFLAPTQIAANVLLHVRRRPQSPVVYAEACRADDGKTIWATQLNNPVIAVGAQPERSQLAAITSTGRVFEVPRESIQAGSLDKPTEIPPAGTGPWNLVDVSELGTGRWFCSGLATSTHALLYDLSAEKNRANWLVVPEAGGNATASPSAFQGGILVGVNSGRVVLLDAGTGKEKVLPFQPPLTSENETKWLQAAVLPPDGTTAVVSDGKRLFRIGIKDQSEPHLAPQAEATITGEITRPLAAAVDTLYVVEKGNAGENLRAVRPDTLAFGASWPLAGGCRLGPVAVQGVVFVADQETLYCLAGGESIRWKIPLSAGPLAAPPLAFEQEFLLLHRSGAVRRISAESGEQLAADNIGEPLSGAAWIMGQQLLVAGADGVLHLVPVPKEL